MCVGDVDVEADINVDVDVDVDVTRDISTHPTDNTLIYMIQITQVLLLSWMWV